MTDTVYSVAQGNLVISAIPIESGLPADADYLTITMNGDDSITEVGADGSTTTNVLENRSATVKVVLAGSSSSNDVLAALREKFLAAKGQGGLPGGVGAFLFQDLSGRAIFKGAKCVPMKPPEPKYGSKKGDLEWTFTVTKIDTFRPHGNNPI